MRSSPARGAQQLLLEARDQPARAELEQLVAALAALERLAVDRARCSRSRRGRRSRPARSTVSSVANRSRSALELARRSRSSSTLRLAPADLESLVLAELGRRTHADLDRERQRLALGGQVADVEVGLADRRDPGLVDRVDVPAAERACAAPRRAPPRGRGGGSRPAAGPCPCGSPGIRIWRPSSRAACWTRRSTSSAETSASTRTRDSGSSVTLVLTGLHGVQTIAWRRALAALSALVTGPLAFLRGRRDRSAGVCAAVVWARCVRPLRPGSC